jgi:hypothetical protein
LLLSFKKEVLLRLQRFAMGRVGDGDQAAAAFSERATF